MSSALQQREKNELEVQAPGAENTRPRRLFIPRADIFESQEKIVVRVDMPGVEENDIDVALENNNLSISGLVSPKNREGFAPALTEYASGDYRRTFTLSNSIDRAGIEAAFKNGVLTLSLPKSKSLLPKKILVNSQT